MSEFVFNDESALRAEIAALDERLKLTEQARIDADRRFSESAMDLSRANGQIERLEMALQPARRQLLRLLSDLEGAGVRFNTNDVRAAFEAVDNALVAPAGPAPLLDLLAKFASGEGGRRTGVLHKLGYLRWRVTELGHEALRQAAKLPL